METRSNLTKLKHLAVELREAPLSEVIYRACSLVIRPSILKRLQPEPLPGPFLSLNELLSVPNKTFLPETDVIKDWYEKNLSVEKRAMIIDAAQEALKGNIIGFSHTPLRYGQPPDWHLSPLVGEKWDQKAYWSDISFSDPTKGDVKLTWELNRFPHVYALVRAYTLTGKDEFVEGLLSQLESWEDENPYAYGVNWASGQELAIRLIAWIFAFSYFHRSRAFTEKDFSRFQRLIYSHALHIERNIGYSRYAVRNNHLIGEALALFLIGSLFPWFDKSRQWADFGRSLLENECLSQFFSDGGYCQYSHNYHRLALHYYLWAIRIAETSGKPLSRDVYGTITKSSQYLYSFMNIEDGRLPNWGPNDGALLNPWTACDYSDFRPLLSAINYLERRKRMFVGGLWDEELLWFYGTEAFRSDINAPKQLSQSFQDSGLHVIRKSNGSFCSLRAGNVRNRFGHADQLHADVWVDGFNLAIDGGSYFYNQDLDCHRHFMGTVSHNTIAINSQDQMLLHRKFKWINPTKAKLVAFTEDRVAGEHYGYTTTEGQSVHRRSCAYKGEQLVVSDVVSNSKPVKTHAQLHWLIACKEYVVQNYGNRVTIKLQTDIGTYWIGIESSLPCKIEHVMGGDGVYGWHSRYYSHKSPALSLMLSCDYMDTCRFTTLFSKTEVVWG